MTLIEIIDGSQILFPSQMNPKYPVILPSSHLVACSDNDEQQSLKSLQAAPQLQLESVSVQTNIDCNTYTPLWAMIKSLVSIINKVICFTSLQLICSYSGWRAAEVQVILFKAVRLASLIFLVSAVSAIQKGEVVGGHSCGHWTTNCPGDFCIQAANLL